MKSVMFITDLHYRGENTATIPNLLGEQERVMLEILKIALDNYDKYEESYIVFLGDIVNTSVTGLQQTRLCMWLQDLAYACTKMFSVVGNHELSYRKNGNVFWSIADGETLVVPSNIKRLRTLLNVTNGFKVDDVFIGMWHYNEEWPVCDDASVKEIVIAGHNAMAFPGFHEINSVEKMDAKKDYVKFCHIDYVAKNMDKLRWVFLGHLHTITGRYLLNDEFKCINRNVCIEMLGSLGLVGADQYQDDNRRNIPCVIIDGGIVSVENNIIALAGRESLDLAEVKERQQKYQDAKALKLMKQQEYAELDVIAEIQAFYEYDPTRKKILQDAIAQKTDLSIQNAMNILLTTPIY